MIYMGSKTKLAKHILKIILKERRGYRQFYVEPFVGGGNMIDKVSGNRIGGDSNFYAIKALETIRDRLDELPKSNADTNEGIYHQMKSSKDPGMKGYYGFHLSFGGKYFGGWRRDSKGKDYIKSGYKAAVRQSRKLQGVQLGYRQYDRLYIPEKSIIYCDPPYKGTTEYNVSKFDGIRFWEWCRQKTREGHIVFISEYNAPDDFECVWEMEMKSVLRLEEGKPVVERLFRYVG